MNIFIDGGFILNEHITFIQNLNNTFNHNISNIQKFN